MNVFEMICLGGMDGVTMRVRIKYDVFRIITVTVRNLEDRVNSRVKMWFGHMLRRDVGRLFKRVLNARGVGEGLVKDRNLC